MANRTKDEVIYVRADRRLKGRFEKQKEESGYKGNADFVGYLLDVNEGKRVDGVTLKEVRELLAEAVHELKKQGVNINQIAHVVNMYAEMFSDSNFKATNYFLKKIEDKLLQISEKLI
ncbi:MobC family plasmid mobilization relaxosome protein [Roseburia sp. MUC/MUC-530-WT-4D]|uniref:MobC family plasmid mobilization relaxosome protein n=1 Tax=Roseburia porci TaxID=2605790 RepID=A0A6L5YRW0_9FIRM|nr:plasmid mobilization relaxosome protein MobC [Roseburia porci]MCI6782000.1 MobC family plasmid mobilization relaxosome protein [Lachnospiraceae bacterium]MST74689.1 MobC family plasmid mobilization relaxosome protein [Roseburia porci]